MGIFGIFIAISKRMFGKYKIALSNPGRSPLAPLQKGGTGLLVPLLKGDLGGSTPTKRIKNNSSNSLLGESCN
jgi:hypothetical protein